MEISRTDVKAAVTAKLAEFQLDVALLAEPRKVSCIRTSSDSMSFVSAGQVSFLLLTNILQGNTFACVLCTKDALYQLSVFAPQDLFEKTTVFHCVAQMDTKGKKIQIEVFDTLVLRGKVRRRETYAYRFESLVDNVGTQKRERHSRKLQPYRHRNSTFLVSMDIMNMFTDLGNVQKEYRERLTSKKKLVGTINKDQDKFEFTLLP